MAHMAQLATMVAPTKSTKQKVPKRSINLGSVRWVMPKTTETKSEQSRTALKWESIALFPQAYADAFLPLARECASTAEMRLSRPPRMRNLVP